MLDSFFIFLQHSKLSIFDYYNFFRVNEIQYVGRKYYLFVKKYCLTHLIIYLK